MMLMLMFDDDDGNGDDDNDAIHDMMIKVMFLIIGRQVAFKGMKVVMLMIAHRSLTSCLSFPYSFHLVQIEPGIRLVTPSSTYLSLTTHTDGGFRTGYPIFQQQGVLYAGAHLILLSGLEGGSLHQPPIDHSHQSCSLQFILPR